MAAAFSCYDQRLPMLIVIPIVRLTIVHSNYTVSENSETKERNHESREYLGIKIRPTIHSWTETASFISSISFAGYIGTGLKRLYLEYILKLTRFLRNNLKLVRHGP